MPLRPPPLLTPEFCPVCQLAGSPSARFVSVCCSASRRIRATKARAGTMARKDDENARAQDNGDIFQRVVRTAHPYALSCAPSDADPWAPRAWPRLCCISSLFSPSPLACALVSHAAHRAPLFHLKENSRDVLYFGNQIGRALSDHLFFLTHTLRHRCLIRLTLVRHALVRHTLVGRPPPARPPRARPPPARPQHRRRQQLPRVCE